MVTAMNAVAAIPGTGASGVRTANLSSADGKQGGAAAPFADLISGAIGQVGQLEAQANAAVSGLMAGTGVDVHQAVIASEKASMAFELALAVRNKAVQAYESVMGMQF